MGKRLLFHNPSPGRLTWLINVFGLIHKGNKHSLWQGLKGFITILMLEQNKSPADVELTSIHSVLSKKATIAISYCQFCPRQHLFFYHDVLCRLPLQKLHYTFTTSTAKTKYYIFLRLIPHPIVHFFQRTGVYSFADANFCLTGLYSQSIWQWTFWRNRGHNYSKLGPKEYQKIARMYVRQVDPPWVGMIGKVGSAFDPTFRCLNT